jgi:hypothetical protein
MDAIWDDDPDAVERLVKANPSLLTDYRRRSRRALGATTAIGGGLQRHRITRKLDELGAAGLADAFDRAGLRGFCDALGGAAYTLSVRDTEFLFRMGARVRQGAGMPVEAVIGSDSRRPADKRRILAIYEEHGYVYPGTAVMAFHRGRFDLLEQHLARDPRLLARTFAIQEIFPRKSAVRQQPYEAMGTPVDGGTLLHLAIYWDELDMATWLLDRGADPNARRRWTPTDSAALRRCSTRWCRRPASGSTIHTAASRGRRRGVHRTPVITRGRSGVRASIRMRLGEGHGDTRLREFRDVNAARMGPPVLNASNFPASIARFCS